MASYLVTGASRGIGFEFARQLSVDPNNTVIALVRDKAGTQKRFAEELDRTNLHVVQADITDYSTLEASVGEVSKLVNGSLDYIIANAGLISSWSAYDPLSVLGQDPVGLEQDLLDLFKTNVVGNIHLFNLYLPLIRNGRAKKVITISSGFADNELTKNYSIDLSAPYSISKAAMNTAVAKFDARHAEDGILFMAICPGTVDTGSANNATEEQQKSLGVLFSKFQKYAPGFSGPAPVEESVKDVLAVVNKASLEDGYGGTYLSHFGNKQWL